MARAEGAAGLPEPAMPSRLLMARLQMGKKKSDYWRPAGPNDGPDEGYDDAAASKSQRQRSRFHRNRKGPKSLSEVEYSDDDGYGMEDIGAEAWGYESDDSEEATFQSDDGRRRGKKRKRG